MQALGLVTLVVRDYDEAIGFFTDTLDFELMEDLYQPEQDKRWVVLSPAGGEGAKLLLARAGNERQLGHIGNQTGGRVAFFLYTDDFWRDYERYRTRGVVFVRPPQEQSYGWVAVFEDLYGNLWDLIEPARA